MFINVCGKMFVLCFSQPTKTEWCKVHFVIIKKKTLLIKTFKTVVRYINMIKKKKYI